MYDLIIEFTLPAQLFFGLTQRQYNFTLDGGARLSETFEQLLGDNMKYLTAQDPGIVQHAGFERPIMGSFPVVDAPNPQKPNISCVIATITCFPHLSK